MTSSWNLATIECLDQTVLVAAIDFLPRQKSMPLHDKFWNWCLPGVVLPTTDGHVVHRKRYEEITGEKRLTGIKALAAKESAGRDDGVADHTKAGVTDANPLVSKHELCRPGIFHG